MLKERIIVGGAGQLGGDCVFRGALDVLGGSFSCVIFVSVSLSIALPVTLSGSSEEGEGTWNLRILGVLTSSVVSV